jgi:hypothetical protein
MSDLGSESRVSRQGCGERAERAGRLLQRILNRIVLSLKRSCPLPHYFPNRELEEEPTIDDEKVVEWPQSLSVIPVWQDFDNPVPGLLYNVCVLREES